MSAGVRAASRSSKLAVNVSKAQAFGREGQPVRSLEHLRRAIQARAEEQRHTSESSTTPAEAAATVGTAAFSETPAAPPLSVLRFPPQPSSSTAPKTARSPSGALSSSASPPASSSLPPLLPSPPAATSTDPRPFLGGSGSAASSNAPLLQPDAPVAHATRPRRTPRSSPAATATYMDDGSLRPLELKHFHRRDHGEEQLQRAIAGVIQAYTNCGQLHEATAFASRALKLPNFMPARNALPALAKDVCDELPPTSVSTLHYKALLESAARQRSVRSARSILLDMLSRELPVNSRIRSGLCRLIVSSANKDTSDMLRMLRRVLPKMQQSGDTSGVGIGDSPRNRRLIKLAEFLDRLGLMDKMILQKPKVLARASQMADQSDRETAEAMRRWALSDMSTPLGSQPQAATSTSASDGTASSQQPSTAPLAKHELLAPLDDIMDLDQPLERAAYAMRMRVFAVLRHDFDSAQRLWRSMIEHGIEPTVKHVEPLVEGLLAVSRLTDAQKLKENAVRIYGIKPSVRLHTALIRAYARDGDDRRLLRELSEFKRNGYQLDETILQIIETAHSQRHPVPVHERSVDLGDLHSVSSRFKVQMRGFAYLEAQQLVAHALDRGLVPDDVLVGFIGRSVNWLDKQCRRHPRHVGPRLSGSTLQRPLDRQELESALDLARQNLARAREVKRLTPLREKVAMRRFRRGVIELILELVDGSLKKEARRLASLRAVAPGLAQKSLIGAASRRLGSRRAQGRKVGRKEDRQPGVERAKARPRATGGGEAVPSVAKPDRRHERVAAAIGPKSADHATDCAAPGSTKEANGGIGGNLVAEVRREEWESKTRE